MKLFESASTTLAPKQLREVWLTAINFIADAVNRTVDVREIADNAVHAILSVTKLDAGAVFTWHESDEALRLFAHRGISEAFARQVASVRKREDADIDSVLEGQTKVIEDFTLKPHALRADVARAGFRSAVLSPIRAQGVVVGMLVLGTYKPYVFEQEDIDLVDVISNQIGNAMVHAQLEANLRASEEQYRGLVENSDDAIYIAGIDGRPRFANPAFQKIFGFNAEEFAATDPLERVHPDDMEAVRAAFAKLALGEAVHSLEYRMCRKDGAWIDLQCNVSVFARNGDLPEEFQFIVREVTQMRQRQQQLLRRNRQLAALTTLAAVANSSLNIEEIARNTLEVALESTGMDGGGIHLADVGRQMLQLYVHTGLPDDLCDELRVLKWGESVSGMVAATGQTKVFTNLSEEAPMARRSAIKHGFNALIVVPVKARDDMLGTLGLASKKQMQFTPEAIEMVAAMGNQLGIAIANANLYEAQLRENEKLNALLDILGGGSQQLELDTLLQRILVKSSALLHADAAYIVRFHGDQAEVVAATVGFQALIGTRYPSSAGLAGQIRTTRQARIFSREEVATQASNPQLRNANLRSVLVVPLNSRNEIIGAIGLTRGPRATGDFTSADLDLIEAFASRAAAAIDNAQLLQDLSHKKDLLQLLIEEAHHRIKNNLQMISGLLQLESERPDTGTASERLRHAISRIQAIAQVHNLLSQEMPEKVDAHVLITTIVNTLVSSAPGPNGPPDLRLNLQHVWLSADQAVALALIVNELVANSLRHGRPPQTARLQLEVTCEPRDGEVLLVVRDNGGGFKDGFDWRAAKGQGFHIVAQLAQVNLRGKLEMSGLNGRLHTELRFAPATR